MDPLAAKYPQNSPYAFSENRVMDAIELEGLEAFFIHGTTNTTVGGCIGNTAPYPVSDIPIYPGTYMFRSNTAVTNEIKQIFNNTTVDVGFTWSGDDTDEARMEAGMDLAMYIYQNMVPGEPITIVGHSHGGNVGILAANYLVSLGLVDPANISVVALNTPDQDEVNVGPNNPIDVYAVSAGGDIVQNQGSDNFAGMGDQIDNADQYVGYLDAMSGLSAANFGNHVGPAPENVAEWGPMLQKAVDKQNPVGTSVTAAAGVTTVSP